MTTQQPTRKLGKNGPQVTAIGYGTMGLSAFYGNLKPDEERYAVLDHVYASGCLNWDTADCTYHFPSVTQRSSKLTSSMQYTATVRNSWASGSRATQASARTSFSPPSSPATATPTRAISASATSPSTSTAPSTSPSAGWACPTWTCTTATGWTRTNPLRLPSAR